MFEWAVLWAGLLGCGLQHARREWGAATPTPGVPSTLTCAPFKCKHGRTRSRGGGGECQHPGFWANAAACIACARALQHAATLEAGTKHSRIINSALTGTYVGPLKSAALRMTRLREERDAMASGEAAAVVRRAPSPDLPSGKPATNTITRKFKKYSHSGTYVRGAVCPSASAPVGAVSVLRSPAVVAAWAHPNPARSCVPPPLLPASSPCVVVAGSSGR